KVLSSQIRELNRLGHRVPAKPSCRFSVPGAAREAASGRSNSRRAADSVADRGEGLVGVGAEGGDGGDADHDDQGQHDRVLDRRRAIFLLQEADELLAKTAHGTPKSGGLGADKGPGPVDAGGNGTIGKPRV